MPKVATLQNQASLPSLQQAVQRRKSESRQRNLKERRPLPLDVQIAEMSVPNLFATMKEFVKRSSCPMPLVPRISIAISLKGVDTSNKIDLAASMLIIFYLEAEGFFENLGYENRDGFKDSVLRRLRFSGEAFSTNKFWELSDEMRVSLFDLLIKTVLAYSPGQARFIGIEQENFSEVVAEEVIRFLVGKGWIQEGGLEPTN